MERREFLELSGAAVATASLLGVPLVQAQRPVPKSEYDYVDWSWQKWRKITGETRPRVSGEQAGRAELVDLLTLGSKRISTPKAWNARREEIKTLLEVFLGEPPKSKAPLAAKTIEETSHDTHILRKVVFETEAGESVPSFLLIPKKLRGKTPVVICPHQTTQAGKKEPAGLAGNPQLQTALHLVQRGFITFTYDAICFGERHDLFEWTLR